VNFRQCTAVLLLNTLIALQAMYPTAEAEEFDPRLVLQVTDDALKPRFAGGDEQKRYYLMPSGDAAVTDRPLGLVIYMPGGDGGEEYRGFGRHSARFALPNGYLLAQLIAPLWYPEQQVTWPCRTDYLLQVISAENFKRIRFTTEDFVDAVIDEVTAQHDIDPGRIFIYSWSSAGPAAYEIAFTNPKVRGAFIAAAVYRRD
jgi:hypothetical protein